MRFSYHFHITITPADDWFDPVLTVDTEVFIDPFLVFAYPRPPFVSSSGQVDAFYDCVQAKVLSSGGSSTSPSWQSAVDALQHCREVADLCLGYTAEGIMGAGIGRVLAQRIVCAMHSIPTHPHGLFGLLPLVSGIADDRISDATACLLRSRLIEYTQEVCSRHGVTMSKASFPRGKYDIKNQKWIPLEVELPHNPFNDKAILLVPKLYLHPRLAIELYDFWDYCREHHDAKVREEFGSSVIRRPTRAQLIKCATKDLDVWKQYLASKTESPLQYDFGKDPMGVVRWYDSTAEYCHLKKRLFKVNSEPLLRQTIYRMTQMFVDYIHNHQGWEMLYSDTGDPLPERKARLLLMGVIMHYCAANKITISREANIGRRPVEFTSPTDHHIRALLLVKFARNTRFWNSLPRHLAKLLSKDEAELIRVMVILHSDRDLERYTRICDTVRNVKDSTGHKVDVVGVGGWPRNVRSASR